jgi:hypothetical protein
MARAYGFRVFVVEAYPNRIKGNEPYSAKCGGGLADEIGLLLRRLAEKGTHRFEPNPDNNGNVTKPVRTATLTSPKVVNAGIIHALIAIGEVGSHTAATRPQAKARSLEGWSAEAAHPITFLFPSDSDSRFLLVTQTNYRRDPHSRLLAMLREESKLVRAEREREDRDRREEALRAGLKAPKRKSFKRLLFQPRQASDNEYLDELLSGADRASVIFKSKRMDAAGKTGYVDRLLDIKLRDQNIIDVGREAGRSWVSRWRRGEQSTHREAVAEIAGLLEDRDLLEEGEHERYESTAIRVHGKDTGASTTIAVDTLRDAFTYPLSDIPPSLRTYFSAVSARVDIIARQEGIEIAQISTEEVTRCLTESTPDES